MFKFYTKKLGTVMFLAICGLFASSEAFAQAPIAVYTFTGAAGSEDSLAVDAQPANATFSHIKRGSALVGTAGANYFTSNNWPTAFDPNGYVRINARPNTGNSLTLTALALDYRHSSSGPATFEIRSSLDNYATVLKSITIPSTTTSNVRDSLVLGGAFANLTSKVEFRIFGYGGTAVTGTGRVDNIKFYGTTQAAGAVPTLNFAAASSTVAENVTGGTLNIPVTITNPSATTATTVTVAIATSAGTATSPADYTITTGTLTFAAGSSANQNAVLTIVNDALVEGAETINLILTSPSTGAVLGSNTTHTVTIQDDDVTAPILSFQTATATVSEAAGTITVPVTISNPNANPTSVNVIIATPAGTATSGADYTFATQTLTFPANSTTTQNATLTIINDQIVDKNETILLTLANPTNNATLVGNTTYTITITDNDLPLYTVAQVTTNNPTTFAADSLNVMARLTGVLYGHNQRPAGLTFALVDNTGGINLFKSTCTPTTCPATPLVQGDSVMVYGKIEQFNGLTQMAVDSIKFIAGNKTLNAPINVTALSEATESELVRIAGPLTIVDPTKWTNAGSGFTVQVTDGTNTYDMRIDADSDIFGTPAPGPTQTFSLVGIGGQFDSSSPYSSGYQILPRSLADIQLITGIKENALATTVAVYPNPVKNEVTVALGEVKGATDMYIINTLGQVVSSTSITDVTTTVNVSNLPAGVYIIRLVQANKTAVKQIVKIN